MSALLALFMLGVLAGAAAVAAVILGGWPFVALAVIAICCAGAVWEHEGL